MRTENEREMYSPVTGKKSRTTKAVSGLVISVFIIPLFISLLALTATLPENVGAVADYTNFSRGTASSNLTITSGADWVKASTEEYRVHVDWSGTYVDFFIKPYFTTDKVMYRRAHAYSGAYTVDEAGTNLDHIGTTVSAWYRSGQRISFNESCDAPARYYINHTFTCFRDYVELNVTYSPGTDTVSTTYFVALTTGAGALLSSARYIPGSADDPVSTSAYGGWYPAIAFAPAMDFRAKTRTLGVEWGYSDAVAYIRSPLWMDLADPFEGGSQVLGVRYCHVNSLVDTEWNATGDSFHLFVRPYQYSDGQLCGHLVGYAQWVALIIASEWGYNGEPVFPLLAMVPSAWDSTLKTWVEASQIKVATYSDNPLQIDWNYKGASNANIVNPTAARVPNAWEMWDSDGQPYTSAGLVTWCTPASGPYTTPGTFRWHLIKNDSYQSWWISTQGVFWDMMDSWNSFSNPRQDYQNHTDFVYEGYLKLIQDSFASGYWNYVISNSYYGSLHMAIVSSITCIESYEPSSSFGVDMTVRVQSIMKFVNNIPDQYRPRILVYQYYSTNSAADRSDVYSAVFGSAKYGFHLTLFSTNSGTAQLHNLQMAEDMFKAMGCSRNVDTRIPVGTLDLASGASSLTTSARMVVTRGSGSPTITFTTLSNEYTITNLNASSNNFDLIIPSTKYYEPGANVQQTSPMTFSGGKGTFHGKITAEKTGLVVIGNPPPSGLQAYFDFTMDGLTVKFSDKSTGQSYSVVGWLWNFGDGKASFVRDPSHTYSAPGTYLVTLQVTNSNGMKDTITRTVIVETPAQPTDIVNDLLSLRNVEILMFAGASCLIGIGLPSRSDLKAIALLFAGLLVIVWWVMYTGVFL